MNIASEFTFPEPIFGQIKLAIASKASPGPATALYIGRKEWDEIGMLCEKWGVGWPPGHETQEGYRAEILRAHFLKVPIYRVDAYTHIAVI